MIAVNATTGKTLAPKVGVADDSASRGKGLLGRDAMGADEGLWITTPTWFVPCPTIHTFFMKFSIDVVFLDAELRAVRVIEDMRPWRLSPWVASARSVLELAGGVLRGGVSIGDRLELRPS